MRLSLILILFVTMLKAQLVTNNGAIFHLDAGSVFHVNGTLDNTAQGTLENFGELTITNDILLNDFSLAEGDGDYLIQGDWVNNALFTANESEVVLTGDDQFIRGNTMSSFFDLSLQGTGVKYLSLDAAVDGVLSLTDRELATDQFKMIVRNGASNAISRTDGFVSSLEGGFLERYCNSASTYLFPTGSSLGQLRYRPLEIIPDENNNRFAVRFVNNSPTGNSLNTNQLGENLCEVNDAWYHEFKRLAGGSEVDMFVYYDDLSEGPFNGIANWYSNQWNYTDTSITSLNSVEIQSWTKFHDEFYVLSNETPGQPELYSDSLFCEGSVLSLEASGGNEGEYIWNIEGGNVVSSDMTASTLDVEWTVGQQNYAFVTLLRNSCPSLRSDTVFISTANSPQVEFSYDNIGYGYNDFLFTSLYNNDMTLDWSFDGLDEFDADSLMFQEFEFEGSYPVSLTVTSDLGCTGTFIDTIVVSDTLSIYNTFTPNDDGVNDVWVALFPENTEWTVQIYNRWGELIKSNQAGIKGEVLWDGRTDTGLEASAGTYYYILNLHSLEDGSRESLNGYITLIK